MKADTWSPLLPLSKPLRRRGEYEYGVTHQAHGHNGLVACRAWKEIHMNKQVETVKANLGLCGGGRYVQIIDVSPSTSGYIAVSAKNAAKLAVVLRESEGTLAKLLQENEVALGRLEDNTATEFYGPSRTNPCLDGLVSVRQNREALSRARKVIEADMLNALDKEDVRAEIAEYALTISDSQDEIASRQEATHEAAAQLKDVIDFSKSLKMTVQMANLGNLINPKTGAYSEPSVFASRHRGIAKVLTEGAEVTA